MKLTIFGATGGTGKQLVRQALADGHDVTAYVRAPSKLEQEHERLTVAVGELDEREKIAEATSGAEAVLSGLGPTQNSPSHAMTNGMRNITAVMEELGVERLIASTGAGVRDPKDTPGLIDKLAGVALRIFAGNVLADSKGMVAAIQNSDLKWTIVRGPRLVDGEAQGTITAGYAGQGPGTKLVRADFAHFMLDQLETDKWVRKMPMISN